MLNNRGPYLEMPQKFQGPSFDDSVWIPAFAGTTADMSRLTMK